MHRYVYACYHSEGEDEERPPRKFISHILCPTPSPIPVDKARIADLGIKLVLVEAEMVDANAHTGV